MSTTATTAPSHPIVGPSLRTHHRSAFAAVVAPLLAGRNGGEQLLDQVLAGLALGLGLEVGADAMAEYRDGGLLDVGLGDGRLALHGCERPPGLGQVDPGSRPGAEI